MKRIAIVHDYFFQFGGAEKVVEKWMEMYPDAEIYTSFFVLQKFSASGAIQRAWIEGRVHTSWLQFFLRGPLLRFQKHLFWLYPIVMSFMTVKNYDVVLISSTYCAKNVKIKNVSKLIHYCHSPTRYLHGMVRETDLKTINPILRKLIPLFTFWLKFIDLRAVKYLNKKGCIWIANSRFIQQTIHEIYKTESTVIYPPIELNRFSSIQRKPNTIEDYYFYFGRISFHKKIQVLIEACLLVGRKVKIAGLSAFKPEMDKLKEIVAQAETENPQKKGLVEFIEKRVSDEEVAEYLKHTKAFLYPPKEDSGMIPVEVLSSGTPVIAFGEGGALEYIQDGVNGLFFRPQTPESLAGAIQRFEAMPAFDPQTVKKTAQPFGEQVFIAKIQELVG